jgi:hypothetical protein
MPILPPNPNAPKAAKQGLPSDRYPFLSRTDESAPSLTDGRTLPQAEWETMLDNGLIINRNPPPSPEVVAAREAADALFRSFQTNRIRNW